MAEYIDREAALEEMLFAMCGTGYQSQAMGALRYVPAADVEPVRHGRWLLKHIGAGHMWECSCCHKRPCIYITEDTAYCPNCGAKMDGEVEA